MRATGIIPMGIIDRATRLRHWYRRRVLRDVRTEYDAFALLHSVGIVTGVLVACVSGCIAMIAVFANTTWWPDEGEIAQPVRDFWFALGVFGGLAIVFTYVAYSYARSQFKEFREKGYTKVLLAWWTKRMLEKADEWGIPRDEVYRPEGLGIKIDEERDT